MSGLTRPHMTRILYGTIDARIGSALRLCELLELNGAELLRTSMFPNADETATGM